MMTSWCFANVPQVEYVFRMDTRSPDVIRLAGGMWPRVINGFEPDNTLVHHFNGQSIVGRTSNFVSTTASLDVAVSFFSRNYSRMYNSAWIYAIRADHNFYDVDASLVHAINGLTDPVERFMLDYMRSQYSDMDEFVARGGIRFDRVVAYAQITRQMMAEAGADIHTTEYWRPRFEQNLNPLYNSLHDNDLSNMEVYPGVGLPDPSNNLELAVDTRDNEMSLGLTCVGVAFISSPYMMEGEGGKQQYKDADPNDCHSIINTKSIPFKETLLRTVLITALDD